LYISFYFDLVRLITPIEIKKLAEKPGVSLQAEADMTSASFSL
ncbi:hypothetical protein FHR85_002647, partial [Alkalibacillus almallahensis]|nr:hypothetical protein [Alkalibacillus almallahensis]